MPVMDHLRELRRRIIIMLVVVAAGAIAAYFFYNPILGFLARPYCNIPANYRGSSLTTVGAARGGDCKLVYLGVLDGFTSRLQVSVIVGAAGTGPIWLFQIWKFITPGLRHHERRYSIIFIAASSTLFAAGMVLAYLTLFKGMPILVAQGGTHTVATITVNYYLSFLVLMLIAFGAAFELPLLVVLGNIAGVLPSKWLRKSQRLAIFLIFVFAAIATPTTDPYTMCALAVPMCLLYEGAVWYATVHDRRKERRREAERALTHLEDDVASPIDPIPAPLDTVGPAGRRTDQWADTT